MRYTIATSGKVYAVNAGGAALVYEDGALKTIRQLTSVSLDGLTGLSALSGNQQYQLDENVQVLLKDASEQEYYATTLSQINASDYRLTGWYDPFGYPAGGRIRILVAEERQGAE